MSEVVLKIRPQAMDWEAMKPPAWDTLKDTHRVASARIVLVQTRPAPKASDVVQPPGDMKGDWGDGGEL